MIIFSSNKALQNIQDNFYYCGVEISKKNFDIKDFAFVCDKINDLKHQLSEERYLNSIQNSYDVIVKNHLYKGMDVFVSKHHNKCFIGLYDTKNQEIVPLTKNYLKHFEDDFFYMVSYQMNKTSSQYLSGIIKPKDNILYKNKGFYDFITFQSYKSNIDKLPNSFYHTHELEFITGYDDYILTDNQLKDALMDR